MGARRSRFCLPHRKMTLCVPCVGMWHSEKTLAIVTHSNIIDVIYSPFVKGGPLGVNAHLSMSPACPVTRISDGAGRKPLQTR